MMWQVCQHCYVSTNNGQEGPSGLCPSCGRAGLLTVDRAELGLTLRELLADLGPERVEGAARPPDGGERPAAATGGPPSGAGPLAGFAGPLAGFVGPRARPIEEELDALWEEAQATSASAPPAPPSSAASAAPEPPEKSAGTEEAWESFTTAKTESDAPADLSAPIAIGAQAGASADRPGEQLPAPALAPAPVPSSPSADLSSDLKEEATADRPEEPQELSSEFDLKDLEDIVWGDDAEEEAGSRAAEVPGVSADEADVSAGEMDVASAAFLETSGSASVIEPQAPASAEAPAGRQAPAPGEPPPVPAPAQSVFADRSADRPVAPAAELSDENRAGTPQPADASVTLELEPDSEKKDQQAGSASAAPAREPAKTKLLPAAAAAAPEAFAVEALPSTEFILSGAEGLGAPEPSMAAGAPAAPASVSSPATARGFQIVDDADDFSAVVQDGFDEVPAASAAVAEAPPRGGPPAAEAADSTAATIAPKASAEVAEASRAKAVPLGELRFPAQMAAVIVQSEKVVYLAMRCVKRQITVEQYAEVPVTEEMLEPETTSEISAEGLFQCLARIKEQVKSFPRRVVLVIDDEWASGFIVNFPAIPRGASLDSILQREAWLQSHLEPSDILWNYLSLGQLTQEAKRAHYFLISVTSRSRIRRFLGALRRHKMDIHRVSTASFCAMGIFRKRGGYAMQGSVGFANLNGLTVGIEFFHDGTLVYNRRSKVSRAGGDVAPMRPGRAQVFEQLNKSLQYLRRQLRGAHVTQIHYIEFDPNQAAELREVCEEMGVPAAPVALFDYLPLDRESIERTGVPLAELGSALLAPLAVAVAPREMINLVPPEILLKRKQFRISVGIGATAALFLLWAFQDYGSRTAAVSQAETVLATLNAEIDTKRTIQTKWQRITGKKRSIDERTVLVKKLSEEEPALQEILKRLDPFLPDSVSIVRMVIRDAEEIGLGQLSPVQSPVAGPASRAGRKKGPEPKKWLIEMHLCALMAEGQGERLADSIKQRIDATRMFDDTRLDPGDTKPYNPEAANLPSGKGLEVFHFRMQLSMKLPRGKT